ncbi:MAG: hypothetical protein HYX81_02185 [Chloroflexi bacterium]|nr:hypothetical protein [Chloroflexota bacterium]
MIPSKNVRSQITGVLHYLFYLAFSLAILGGLLLGKYVLTLDMVLDYPYGDKFYAIEPFRWVDARLPYFLLLGGLKQLLPMWLVQKLFLVAIFFLAGVSAHHLIRTRSEIPRYFAGILYALNPFTYVRLLAGQDLLLLGYAVTPFAVRAFMDLCDESSRKNVMRMVLWTTLVGIFSAHMLALTFLLYLLLLTFWLIKKDWRTISRKAKLLAIAAVLFFFVNAFWLIPILSGNTVVETMGKEDVLAFLPRTGGVSPLFAIASMHGFWRTGYVYAKDFIPLWQVLFGFILFLLVYGTLAHWKSFGVKAFVVISAIALVLGSGASGPFSAVFEFLSSNIPWFIGFRDSQKFVVLLVLAYSYLGGLGLNELLENRELAKSAKSKTVYVIVTFFALVTPVIYAFPGYGFNGQLKTTDYPPDWYQVNQVLKQDAQDFNALFLPWHGYMDFQWLPNRVKRIQSPAAPFFAKPVIAARTLEMFELQSQFDIPGHTYIESLLAQRDTIRDFGERLKVLNVKYVILAKEADYEKYAFLYSQPDLELVSDTDTLVLFRNRVPVSRFYAADSAVDPSAVRPLEYTRFSPVRYRIASLSKSYVVFVPPNLGSRGWVNGTRESLPSAGDFYAVFEASGSAEVGYARFRVYLTGYLITILTGVTLLVYYVVILRRRKATNKEA